MQKLTAFYLEGCPYCKKAVESLKELKAENSAYEKAEIDWIEESKSPDIANSYDYYYVPSFFLGDTKLYECSPKEGYEEIKQQVRKVLDTVLSAE